MSQEKAELGSLLKKLPNNIPQGGTGLEVGTHTGRTTTRLIEQLAPSQLVLVDPWCTDPAYRNRPFAQKTDDAALADARAQVRESFGDAEGVEIHAETSANVLKTLKDGAFDWIYLDGCKYYPELLADLERGFGLLKPGGVILGAGLDWGPQLGFPVRAAVEALVARIEPAAKLIEDGVHYAIVPPESARLIEPTREPRFLVVSTMKNEAPFILEWVAHYRAIGFTDFLVYTNDCDDTTVPLLDRLTERGLLRHEPNHVLRRGPHKSALKYAQDHWLVAQADWVLICDVDEFLNLKTHDTIQALLADLPEDTDMVPFPWQVFGSGGVAEFRDLPVTEQFSRCEPGPDEGGERLRDIKTIFRKATGVDRFGLHRPRFKDNQAEGFVWRTANGRDISRKMNTSAASRVRWRSGADVAYINHYPIRAVESYLIKKLRGRANHVRENLGEEYFRRWNLNQARDTSISRLRPAMQAELDGLMADPETARLHAEGVEWMRTRIGELKQDATYKDLYETLCAAQTETENPIAGE